jgi:tripartite-type tricarboxylate transporter receptor subunit TctC
MQSAAMNFWRRAGMKNRIAMRFAMAFAAGIVSLTGNVTTASPPKEAPSYPAKPIHLVVATVPGVPPDIVARILAEPLQALLGQPIVIENRAGAIGSIGLAAVARSAPDGYVLGMMAMPYVVAPSLLHVDYDIEKDFAPISLVSRGYSVLAVPTDSPVRSVPDLIALARARPGTLTFSTPGNATPSHLAATLLQRETATSMRHIPYKGTAAVVGLLAGDVDFTIGSPYTLVPHAQAGKLRMLAALSPSRLSAYPEIPTLRELGYPDADVADWQGLVAPAGTPAGVIVQLHAALTRVLAMPDVQRRFATLGREAVSSDPDEFGKFIAVEHRRWNALVREAGIRAE